MKGYYGLNVFFTDIVGKGVLFFNLLKLTS